MKRKVAICATLLLWLTLLSYYANAQGQTKVVFGADKEPLSEVLTRLSKLTGINIGYPTMETKKAGNVSLGKASRTLDATLKLLLKGTTLDYKYLEGRVVLFKKPSIINEPSANRETINIEGRVIDESGQVLPGISITLQGTGRGVITDGTGGFKLEQVSADAVISAEGVGYSAQSFTVATTMLIPLKRVVSDLDEVQVIAYGTTTKRISTGSVSSITAKDLATQPVGNPLAAMQGRVPGLIISQTSGIPGSAFKVQLRGQSALDLTLSQNDPLFVIDGVPFEQGNTTTNQLSSAATANQGGGLSALNLINPADIERIDVLKDADATAIYGSRGANGVILITTKKGAKQVTEASVSFYSGISQVPNTPPMLNTSDYVMMRKEAFTNDNIEMTSQNAPDLLNWDTTRYTDFKKLLIGRDASVNNVNLGVTGGTDLTHFRIAAGYRRETSVYSQSLADRVVTASLNVSHRTSNDRLSLNLSAVYGNDQNRLPSYDLSSYLSLPPNLKLYNEDGSLAWDDGGVTYSSLTLENPLARLNSIAESENENLSANLNINFKLLRNLSLRFNSGYNSFKSDERSINPSTAISSHSATLPSAQFSNNSGTNWIVEPQMEWRANPSIGSWTILVGSTLQERLQKGIIVTGSNYTSDLLLNSIAGAGDITSRNRYSLYRYSAFFGRINYNYKNRYIVNITGRRDGSGRFGPENRWANFGAVGLAWVFTKEEFFRDEHSVLSFGKLRTSYGTTGNDQIGDYKYLNLWENTRSTYDGQSGLMPISLFNPAFSWEINKKMELGLDLGFLREKLNLTVNYFRNRSNNQLLNYMLSGQTGFFSVVRNFPGLVQNTGLEAVVSSSFKFNQLTWSSSINATFPQNKLLAFPGLENSSYTSTYVIGKSLSVLQGYKFTGVDAQTGIYGFIDKNGDGEVYYLPDYYVLGDRDPDFYGGIQNTLGYKGIGISFFIHFTKQRGKNYINQFSRPPGNLVNQPEMVLERWRKPGDIAPIQRFTTTSGAPVGSAVSALSSSDGAYTDASFGRLKNVSVSYSFPQNTLLRTGVKNCRVFFEGQNLATVTSYKGLDPETQNFYILPPLQTFTLGIQLGL